MLSEFKKALYPALVAALGVGVSLVVTGEWDRIQTAAAYTAFVAAATTALVPNLPDAGIWKYLKVIVPAFVTFSSGVALWISEGGSIPDETITVFLVGAGVALIARFTGNGGNTNEVGSYPIAALTNGNKVGQPLGIAHDK